ncbi:SULT1 [Mytilus coruscus]|uniref:SULT1 n=1 Tax=Mytilus coruscus TaxID=42192 RepID=A0A6J8ERJ7_MYTCO|nr:SULT1 [Mytilus coruscus]
MAAPPVGRYKIGPRTEKDTLIEYAITPRSTVKSLQVGDAIQHLAPGSEDSSFLPDIREILPLIQEMMPVYEDDVFIIAHAKIETDTNHNWFYYTKKLQEMLYDQTDLPIHNVYYEDMKSNPVDEVKKIVEYLGINRADDFIHQVVYTCCFDNLKKADNTKVAAIEGVPKQAFSFMYRKGEVGDWKNHFTVAENEEFDRIYNKRMKDIKFTYKNTL